jgi:hypothetical protein
LKLYGIWVAQDEGDIIRATLEFHRKARAFEKIFFYDLGSTDDTLAIATEFGDIAVVEQRRVPYSGDLRLALIEENARYYAPGDWVAIIDSDEIYGEDPRAVIRAAEAEGATRVETWQAQFYFSDADLRHWDRGDAAFRSQTAYDRMRHYVINWSEMRFYKCLTWSADRRASIDLDGKLATRRLLNRHYPYRSPDQIRRKVELRTQNRRLRMNTQYQIFSQDWRRYVVDHRLLHLQGDRRDPWKFGAPVGVDWKRFYNFWANDAASWKSPAYNNTYIYWMMQHGFLPPWSSRERALKMVGKAVQRVRGRDAVGAF